jgi:hypothetical protein
MITFGIPSSSRLSCHLPIRACVVFLSRRDKPEASELATAFGLAAFRTAKNDTLRVPFSAQASEQNLWRPLPDLKKFGQAAHMICMVGKKAFSFQRRF